MVKDILASKAVEKTFLRFTESDQYKIPYVYHARTTESWPGDWVGRTLLALNHLYELTGRDIPAMHEIVNTLEDNTNENGHIGKPFDGMPFSK